MIETLATRNADCLLMVTATHQPKGQLDLRYHVQNHGELALYLYSQLYELAPADSADASPRPDPNLAHIQVDTEGIKVDKALMDLSFRDGIRVLDIPYLTQVLPGHSHEQTLSLALPLHPYRVHGSRPGQAPPVPLPLHFSLGYFKGESGITICEPLAGLPADTYQVAPSHSNEQQVLTAGPFQESVPVANAIHSTEPAPAASPESWTPWG
jgi:hypothetical protein